MAAAAAGGEMSSSSDESSSVYPLNSGGKGWDPADLHVLTGLVWAFTTPSSTDGRKIVKYSCERSGVKLKGASNWRKEDWENAAEQAGVTFSNAYSSLSGMRGFRAVWAASRRVGSDFPRRAGCVAPCRLRYHIKMTKMIFMNHTRILNKSATFSKHIRNKEPATLTRMSFWLTRMSFWLASMSFWLTRTSFWLTRMSYWLSRMSFWLARMSFWLTRMSFWLTRLACYQCPCGRDGVGWSA